MVLAANVCLDAVFLWTHKLCKRNDYCVCNRAQHRSTCHGPVLSFCLKIFLIRLFQAQSVLTWSAQQWT